MRTTRILSRLLLALALVTGGIAPAAAQEQESAMILLRPHCEEAEQNTCPAFDVQDPATQQTPILNEGDTLDMDIVVRNPAGKPIRRVRAWLSYDTQTLEGVSIALSGALILPVPGEAEFSPEEGFAKIGAAAEEGAEPTQTDIVIARVQFLVKKAPAGGQSPIVFHDQKPDVTGHTYAATGSDGAEDNLLSSPAGTLVVRIAVPEGAPEDAAAESGSGTVAPANQDSALPFTLLQVQNLRVTSQGTTLYVAWEGLRTARLQGYNVYYGKQMGRYIQRRSLAATASTLAVRDLPQGTTYYVSIRAVDEAGQESAFSREVAVEIGNPATSTSPLPLPSLGGTLDGNVTPPSNPVDKPGRTGGTAIPGEAGLSSVVLLAIASAAIGGLFAFRRQCIALTHSLSR